jgi:hypothetical protein
MKMKKAAKRATTVVAVAAMVLLGSTAWASSTTSQIMVSADVAGKLSQTIHHQISSLTVTEQDIKKGYVDVSTGTVLEIKSNDPSGYMMNFEMSGSVIHQAMVQINHRSIVVSDDPGFIHQPFPGLGGETLRIGYRLFLNPDAKPGVYAWPLTIAASLNQ